MFWKGAVTYKWWKNHARLCEALMYMVVKDNLPLSFCDLIAYRTYTRISTPLSHPPKSTAFTQALDEKYDALFPVVKVDISKAPFVSLTMDLWKESKSRCSWTYRTLYMQLETEIIFVRSM